MKKRIIKVTVTVFCMMIAGTIFSCSKKVNIADAQMQAEAGTPVGDEEVSEAGEPVINSGMSANAGYDDAADSAGTGSGGAVDSAESGSACLVHVCGAVKSNGLYELKAGSRIADAIDAAGGFSDEADEDYLNLAELIYDGEKIYVPTSDETSELTAFGESRIKIVTGDSAESVAGDGRVSINNAGKDELMTLPGIGEKRAGDIIEYRDKNGRFEAAEDIMKVPGIKSGAYEKIKDLIKV